MFVFGVDVGGTTIKFGLFSIEGKLLDKWEIATRKEENGKYIIDDIATSIKEKMLEKAMESCKVSGVGIGVPGPVTEDGTVLMAANLGWSRFNINEKLEAMLGIKVKAGNDANVAALGEMWRGGGQGYTDMVAVTLGTGVGGGIIIGGKVVCGTNGAGGEIGHIHIEDDELNQCGCGNIGCLEQYTSATGIVTLANRRLAMTDVPSVLRDSEVTAKAVWDAVKRQDSLAIDVAKDFGKYLGKGLAIVASVIDPQIFVVGGGVSKAGDILIEYIQPYFDRYVFKGSSDTKFALATLGNDAGIYGAAKLVLD